MPNIFVTSFLHRQSAASAALYWYSATIRQQLSPYFEGIYSYSCCFVQSNLKRRNLLWQSQAPHHNPSLKRCFNKVSKVKHFPLVETNFEILNSLIMPLMLWDCRLNFAVDSLSFWWVNQCAWIGLLYVLSRQLLRLQKVAARSSRYQSLPLSILQGGEHRFGFKIGTSRPYPPCGVSQLLCRYMLT